MNTSRLSAGASRFAHLAGLTRGKRGSRAEDERREDARAEEDDEDEHAEDDDNSGDDGPKGKKGRKARAEEDDDDQPKGKSSRRASDDDDDDEDGEPKARGKRSRRAEEDDDDRDAEDEDDDKEEMSGRSAKASARRREQSRIAHILGHSAAAANLPLAVSLACDTRMTRREAVAVLQGQADREPARQERRVTREQRNADLSSSDEPGGRKPRAGSSWGRSFAALGFAPPT